MQPALFITWAWCPKCSDFLLHKRYQRLETLTCPQHNLVCRAVGHTLIPLKIDDRKNPAKAP